MARDAPQSLPLWLRPANHMPRPRPAEIKQIQEDDFDSNGNSETDVAFHVRRSPIGYPPKPRNRKTEKRYHQIAFDKSDQEVDRG